MQTQTRGPELLLLRERCRQGRPDRHSARSSTAPAVAGGRFAEQDGHLHRVGIAGQSPVIAQVTSQLCNPSSTPHASQDRRRKCSQAFPDGGKVFAKLDLTQAYQQLIADDKAAEAQTIITHWGASRVRGLQFGISVAPGIFQRFMEKMLAGITGVVPYFDNVLIMGLSREKLTERLREVLQRFDKAGIRVKREMSTGSFQYQLSGISN
ncbi:hypothetical protein Y1Q_0007401 [Alligator mississippiensis]|uniref:ribonuclease H n=1 Tax=Alligator mississippiensis TaxID=8496 RepID=A0A151P7T7_ALLMI|nr:hypothetical protein Y1Q_0007401 [Alligator mississippiensis]